jgi:integrase
MKDAPAFTSPFGMQLNQFIEHKRMQGYKFITGEWNLRCFDAYVTALRAQEERLTKELVEAYIALRPGEKPSNQSHRISAMRCFGKYLVRCGVDAYVLPYGVLSIKKYGFIPHIFNEEEIIRFMNAADSLPETMNSPLRHIVIPMMFRMIYGCGLRISEACNLLAKDVDINNGVLFIRGTKFNKDRYVPMAKSLRQRCRSYVESAPIISEAGSPFFPNSSNNPYTRSTIGHAFRQCLVIAGIPHFDDGPTVHSLRHSFAVRNLVKWGMEGKDANALLPYLSAYMGHENLLGTERYLRLTMDAFPELRERIKAGCSWMMPEVVRHEG